MKNAVVSIIIPAYNIENYIEKTLDSVLVQTYGNLEVIIVNDGSKDNTASIIDSFAQKDSRIKVIHKENGGVTSARLAGISVATGDYIGFVDGDDYIEPNMFELLVNNAIKYNADISHCGYQMVFPNRVDYYYNTGKIVEQDNIKGINDLLRGEFIEPGLVNKLYRRDLVKSFVESDIMDKSIKINEDLLMNYYLFKSAKKSVFQDVCPYHYMVRKGSAATSAINEHKLKNPLTVWKTIYKNIDYNNELSALAYQAVVRKMIDIATISAKANKSLIKPYRKKVRKELRKSSKKGLGKGLKLLSIWAAYMPTTYRWVHNFYSKANGNANKYDID